MELKCTYMGLTLRNPIIVGASTLTTNLETIQRLEEAGAAAVVIASLFEEQIQLERLHLEEDLAAGDDLSPEMARISGPGVFPRLEHAGPEEHLMWVRRAKESVNIPVIASLNAVNIETWVEYAARLADTGVDGLELNFYATPSDPTESGAAIEARQVAIVQAVREKVALPIGVKLSAFYTNPLHVASRLAQAGAGGLVLFNRFFQPDIDPEEERNTFTFTLSRPGDYGLSLRVVGLLYGQVAASLCANTGIHDALDVARLLLAGADCVQVVSTLLANGVSQLTAMLRGLEAWMERKGYRTLDDFRGRLSHACSSDPWMYTRAQYVRALMKRDPLGRGTKAR